MKRPLNHVRSTEDSSSQWFADRKVVQAGQHFFSAFVSALKTAQLYDPNNHVFVDHATALCDRLRDIFRMEDEAAIEVTADHLFFNGLRLPTNFASYPGYRFLINNLIESGVGKIWFEEEFNDEEVRKFLVIFSKSKGRSSESFDDLETQLRTEGITGIHLEKPQEGGGTFRKISAIRQVGKQMYLNSILLLKKMTHNLEPRRRIQAKVVRRLVQTIVDAVTNDEAYMLALTNIKNHYDYTLNHSVNVSVLSVALGYRLGIERTRLADLGISALFHDIGKVNVPKEILSKPSRLTEEEFELVKKHPYHGAEMLTRVKGLGKLPVRAIIVAIEHHMGVDLCGYPNVSMRKDLNLFSKIISIADVFDAMTTPRVYRKRPFTRSEAISEMMKESGTKFDPLLLKAFSHMLGLYPIGTVVLLNTGELALVMETNHNPLHLSSPKIKVIVDSSGSRTDGEVIDLASSGAPLDGVKRAILKSVDATKYEIDVTAYF